MANEMVSETSASATETPSTTRSQAGVCDCNSAERIPCSQITDGICERLWSPSNNGTLIHQDHKIREGQSPIDGLSVSKYEDLRALIRSKDRLPADLRNRLRSNLGRLDKLLRSTKVASADFMSELSLIEQNINNQINFAIDDRFRKKHPTLLSKKTEDWKPEIRATWNDIRREIYDQIMEAKYKNSPNWNRVEKLFGETRETLLRVLKSIPKERIKDEDRSRMIERIRSIQLTLPYQDLSKWGGGISCQTTEENAFYSRDSNKFTFCMGYLAKYQSDAALMMTMAHELGHAIDPNTYSAMVIRQEGSYQTSFRAIYKGEFSCEQFKELVSKSTKPLEASDRNPFPLKKLRRCLAPEQQLQEFTTENVQRALDPIFNSWYSQLANSEGIIQLTTQFKKKDGKTIENPFFLNPQLFRLNTSSSHKEAPALLTDATTDILTLSLKCNGYENAKMEDRPALVRRAIDETRTVVRRDYEERSNLEGRASRLLVNSQLAVESGEAFADWISFQVLQQKLSSIPSLTARREHVALTAAPWCPAPSDGEEAEAIREALKDLSLRAHPLDSVRRAARITPQIAELLNCQPQATIQYFGGCQP